MLASYIRPSPQVCINHTRVAVSTELLCMVARYHYLTQTRERVPVDLSGMSVGVRNKMI